MNTKIAIICCVVIFVVIAGDQIEVARGAVSCNPLQLSPCASAITSSSKPSATCCAKLKEQRPCLCQYMRNPNLQKFIKSSGAKKVASSCRIPYPKC
ncbi:hypothetical protein ACP275_12G075400 [Erythranthe tilingii]